MEVGSASSSGVAAIGENGHESEKCDRKLGLEPKCGQKVEESGRSGNVKRIKTTSWCTVKVSRFTVGAIGSQVMWRMKAVPSEFP